MNHFFWTKYPFVQVGFAFIGGNALAYTFTELPDFLLANIYYHWLLVSVLALALTLLVVLVYHIRKRIMMNGFLILLLFFCLGIIHYVSHDQRHSERQVLSDRDTSAVIYGEVTTEPEFKNKSTHFLLDLKQIMQNDQWHHCKITVKVTLADTSSLLAFKDVIVLKGKLSKPLETETPYDFNYARFLAYQNIHYTLYVKEKPLVLTVSSVFIISPKYYAIKARQKLEALLTQKIKDKKAYALVTGLLVGKRSDLDEEDKQLFTTSGTIHVLAVSGMHVVLIYQSICFLAMLFRIRQHGIVFNLIVLALIWFYIFITGLQASASRAAIMITLVLLAKLVQRDNQNTNSLMATACLMLLYNPYYLADAGFILSFLAVIGIVISSTLSIKENKNKILTYLFNASLISTAAQTATFPYSIHLFHQFPVYFLLANLIVVPLTTLLLFLSVILLIAYSVPYINDAIVWSIQILTDGLFYTLQFIAHLPWPLISRISLSTLEMVLLYIALVIGILLFIQRNAKWLWGITISLTLLCISLQYRMIWQFHHPAIFISGKKEHRQYLCSTGHQAWVITHKGETTINRAAESFLTDHFIGDSRIIQLDVPRSFILQQGLVQVGVSLNKPSKTPAKTDFFKNCEALILDYTIKYSYLDPNKQPIPHQKIFLLYGKKSFYSTFDL
jgi:competence protein ComEC